MGSQIKHDFAAEQQRLPGKHQIAFSSFSPSSTLILCHNSPTYFTLTPLLPLTPPNYTWMDKLFIIIDKDTLESKVQFSSVPQSCPTLCDPMDYITPGLPVHHQLLEFTHTHDPWVGDAIQPSYPLSSPSPAFIFPNIRVFSNESFLCIRWPKFWSFNFSISPSNEYSGLISFRMDWLDLLAVQGTLKSLLQHHSSKSINTFALSFLYSPTLKSILDNYSYD